MFDKELDNIKKSFFEYLNSLGLSAKSHKNYRSDLNHFSGWVILKVRSFGSYIENLTEAVPFISKNLILEYSNYLSENNIPVKTINRRFSTLRHFAKFLESQNMVDENFMEGVENISLNPKVEFNALPILSEYKTYLEAKKASPSTIKNYTSDVRQFLNWIESNSQINN